MIIGYETGLNTDDQTTYELKKLTVWVPSSDGGEKVTYTTADFADQITKINANGAFDGNYTNDTGILDTVSQLAFDSNGKVLFVSTDATTPGTPDDAAVATATAAAGLSATVNTDSATTLTLADNTTNITIAPEALVLQKNGPKDYAVTTVSDINLNQNYFAAGKVLEYHQALGTASDIEADVVIVSYQAAANAITGLAYGTNPTAAMLVAGAAGNYTPTAPAVATSGDDITYSLATGADAAFTINATTGVVSWTAAPAAGTYQLTVVAEVAAGDLTTGWASPAPQTVNLTVTTTAAP